MGTGILVFKAVVATLLGIIGLFSASNAVGREVEEKGTNIIISVIILFGIVAIWI